MSERLVVDSIMTADGEVVPLGPVDKDGHRVPFDTTDLYGPRDELGFGHAVCPRCYEDEFREMGESCDL